MNPVLPSHWKRNRQGVTLLFVISMVVLFLLLGTAFVTLSNDFFRTSRLRARSATNPIDQVGLLDEAFFQLLRGPRLTNSDSPLRGHSILADQYGYGYRATIAAISQSGQFLDVSIDADDFREILEPGVVENFVTDDEYFDGFFNGQVLSILTDEGFVISGRIVETTIPAGSTRVELLVCPIGFEIQRVANSNDLVGDRVIINGREFTGLGAGEVNNEERGESFQTPDSLPSSMASIIQESALQVNQVGIPFNFEDDFRMQGFMGGTNDPIEYINLRLDNNREVPTDGMIRRDTGYLALRNSVNEPYDAPDFNNMYLSGVDSAGNIIPSFHRDSLLSDQFSTSTANQRFTFRPASIVLRTGEPIESSGFSSTAYSDTGSGLYTLVDPSSSRNSITNLDVDADGDGMRDSVWIDIGLPVQTDEQGRQFKPLFGYRVIDLDGRLNVNALGSFADQQILDEIQQRQANGAPLASAVGGRGSGFGPADVSLSAVTNNYQALLESRHFDPDPTGGGNDSTAPGSHPNIFNRFSENQKLFGYPTNGLPNNLNGSLFATSSNLLGSSSLQALGSNEMPELAPAVPSFNLTGNALVNPYLTNFGLNQQGGDSLFTARELEELLRQNDPDSSLLLGGRLRNLINTNMREDITVRSFEVAVQTSSLTLAERLNILLRSNGAVSSVSDASDRRLRVSQLIRDLIPRELLLGRKFDLNRPFGDTLNGAGQSAQRDSPVFDLDNNPGDGSDNNPQDRLIARYLFAKDLYVTVLLACGDRAPAGFELSGLTSQTFPGPGRSTEGLSPEDREYRKMIAQWAVNVVDYRDPDGAMTPFEFDIEPFDAGGWEVNGIIEANGNPGMINDPANNGNQIVENDAVVVWGCERVNLMLTESFAHHDRQTDDTDLEMNGATTTAQAPDTPDDDFDSINAPITSAVIEIHNPWATVNAHYPAAPGLGDDNVPPADLDSAAIDISATVNGNSPVWRIGLKRQLTAENDDIVRSIYFTNPSAVVSDVVATGDSFFPSTSPNDIAAGDYLTIASSNTIAINTTTNAGGGGAPINVGIAGNPTIIDMPRPLSISDPNGGYIDPNNANGGVVSGGTPFAMPLDTPIDGRPNPNAEEEEDVRSIFKNGVSDNFRFAYLQRLADPTQDFDPITNPYRTIDVLGMDLLSLNGLKSDPLDTGLDMEPIPGLNDSIGTQMDVFEFRSLERGETLEDAMTAGRVNFFANDFGLATGMSQNPNATSPTGVTNSFGQQNSSYTSSDPMQTLGCLWWSDRPLASAAEIANVPFLPSRMLTTFFNSSSLISANGTGNLPIPVRMGSTKNASSNTNEIEAYNVYVLLRDFFANVSSGPEANFSHLLRFSRPLGTAAQNLDANRFANLFDFIEVPNRFLGSEEFLPLNSGQTGITNFEPPFHFVPNFRVPGKVNLNTMTENTYNALLGSFTPSGFSSFSMFRGSVADQDGPTDFAGVLTSSEGRQFVPVNSGISPAKGSTGTIFELGAASAPPAFDATAVPAAASLRVNGNGAKDVEGSFVMRNELRQRLSNLTTTRSSVFAIWITVGYFRVDELGRIGTEIGSEDGTTRRNRAFYMVDRSIPVAFEPGENHNVSNAVLLRTIIE